VKRPLMVILSGDIKNRALRTLVGTLRFPTPLSIGEDTNLHRFSQGYTDFHGDTPIFMGIHRSSQGYTNLHGDTTIFMGTVVFHMIFMGSCVDFIGVFVDDRYP